MNKKISFPIAIIIIVVLAVLVGVVVVWQCWLIPKYDFLPIRIFSKPSAKEFTIGLDEEAEVIYKTTEDPSVIHNTINYLVSLRNIDTQNKSAAINLETESRTCFFPEDLRFGGRPANTLYLGEEAYCFTSEECGVRFNLIALENTKATFKTFESCAPPGPEKPVLPQEIIIKKIEQITITTDKTEYGQGETVKITIINGLDKSTWYLVLSPDPSCCTLYKWEQNKWINLGIPFNVIQVVASVPSAGVSPVEPEELKPGESIHREWNMKRGEFAESFLESGKYRFSFYYGLNKNNYTEIIYSNEFTIKEKEETLEGSFRSVLGVKDPLSCYCGNGGYVTTISGEVPVCFEDVGGEVTCDNIIVKGFYKSKEITPGPIEQCRPGTMRYFKMISFECK